MFITTQDDLKAFIKRMRKAAVVGVDTEFMREKTYFARLCLVQISDGEEVALIDPLALKDLSALEPLMTDPQVVKVFHAGGQDLEILYRLLGKATSPVFDTQLAATLVGLPQQAGYGALLTEVLGVTVDKGDSFTDWSRRPLTSNQLKYAENDVLYLPKLHAQITAKLNERGRQGWLRADLERLEDPETYQIVPEEQFRRVKRVTSLNRRHLGVAREVAAWREREAIRRDIPKRWVLADESLIEIARRMPQDRDALAAIRGVGEKVGKSMVSGLLEAVARGAAIPEDELPSLERRHRPVGNVDGAVDLMIALVRVRAREAGVAMPLVASRDDLERFAGGDRSAGDLLEGWRKSLVGDELEDLLAGQIRLSVRNGELVVERV